MRKTKVMWWRGKKSLAGEERSLNKLEDLRTVHQSEIRYATIIVTARLNVLQQSYILCITMKCPIAAPSTLLLFSIGTLALVADSKCKDRHT